MSVSIIIPSLNSPIIDQLIDHLYQQTAVDQIGEILVVGRDELGLLQVDAITRLIDTGQPVIAPVARNIGIAAAQYDLLLFLDSDCLPAPTWLAAHLAAQAAGHSVVGGGVLPTGRNYWSLSYNLTLFYEFYTTAPIGPRDYLPTLNLSLHREVITAVGVMSDALARGQDIEWTLRMRRAGYQPYFWPTAVIEHVHNRTTLQQVWQDCARSGFYMRQVRMAHDTLMEAPTWLRSRAFLLAFSPLIAAGVTARIIRKRPSILRYWHTLPAIYLTKIAWCWGAGMGEAYV